MKENMWLLSLFILSIFYSNINCSEDDANLKCEDDTICHRNGTCCPGKGNYYMCCPVENAVCCIDGEHCCPGNTRCDLRQMRCVGVALQPATNDVFHFPFITHTKLASNVNSMCPDHVHSCTGAETCCVGSGTPRCCPYSYGTCCSDGLHCCPASYSCIGNICVASGPNKDNPMLDTKNIKVDMKLTKLASNVNSMCPDHVHSCTGAETCCVGSGTPRCCPYSYGTCCADGLHCCPAGNICISNTCLASEPDKNIPLLDAKFKDFQSIICEDGHRCDDNSTCCQLSTENWGCCPLENAVCCQDKIHCCPAKTICGGSDAICIFSDENLQ